MFERLSRPARLTAPVHVEEIADLEIQPPSRTDGERLDGLGGHGGVQRAAVDREVGVGREGAGRAGAEHAGTDGRGAAVGVAAAQDKGVGPYLGQPAGTAQDARETDVPARGIDRAGPASSAQVHIQRGRPGGAGAQRAAAEVERGRAAAIDNAPGRQQQQTAVEIVGPAAVQKLGDEQLRRNRIGPARLREDAACTAAVPLAEADVFARCGEEAAAQVVRSVAAVVQAHRHVAAAGVGSARLREAAAAGKADPLQRRGEQAAAAEVVAPAAASVVGEHEPRKGSTKAFVPPDCVKLPLPEATMFCACRLHQAAALIHRSAADREIPAEDDVAAQVQRAAGAVHGQPIARAIVRDAARRAEGQRPAAADREVVGQDHRGIDGVAAVGYRDRRATAGIVQGHGAREPQPPAYSPCCH